MEKLLNIKKEKKIIELLGLTISKPDNSDDHLVLDRNGKKVGVVGRKPDTYEYYTEIDSDIVKVRSGSLSRFEFPAFYIKFKDISSFYIHIGPYLTAIDSHDYKNERFIFRIEPDKVYINFGIQDRWNFHETIEIDLSCGKYTYEVCYKMPKVGSDDYIFKTGFLECQRELNNPNFMEIKNTWRVLDEEKQSEKTYFSKVEGTIEETIKKHRTTIESFSYFRSYINNLLPLEQDIISYLIKNAEFEYPEVLGLFIPELKKCNKSKRLKKQINS